MESTLENPVAFFDYYLKKAIYKDWNNYSSGIVKNVFNSPFDEIDKQQKILKVYNSDTNEYVLYSFENHLKVIITDEIQKSKHFIELGFQHRFSNTNEINGYAEFLKIKIQELAKLQAFVDFNFMNSIIEEIEALIHQYSLDKSVGHTFYSFNLLVNEGEDQNIKIDALFGLLSDSPPIIKSTKADFQKAFSGKEIANKIHWLVEGKNKLTSKVSLFYFIDELIRNKLISNNVRSDLNKYIQSIFCDSKGDDLRNLKQSKSTYSKNPSSKDRLDSIISNLLK